MALSNQSLLRVPGVGKSIAKDLHGLGIQTIFDLKGKDPQELYDQLCKKVGSRVDPCVLYTFRCAVYFVNTKNHNPNLLKWWNWKNEK